MTGFEPGCSDIVGDHAVNCATTTAQQQQFSKRIVGRAQLAVQLITTPVIGGSNPVVIRFDKKN